MATSGASEPVRERGDSSVRVLQMNLCDSGHAHCYTGRSVAEASEVIRAENPDVVTVNEVCQDDVAALEAVLTGATAVAVAAVAVVRSCRRSRRRGTGAPVPRSGAATAGRTGSPLLHGWRRRRGVRRRRRRLPDAGSRGDAELRAWLFSCLGPPAPADDAAADATAAVAVCTTHLASGSPAVARAQCAYLLGTAIPAVRARAGSAPVILGGDLNLRSGDSPAAVACLPADDRRADDGRVQHVVATPELVVGSPRTIAMPATDHPGLLVTLSRSGAGESSRAGASRRQ